MNPITILAPTGSLGYGFDPEALDRAMALKPAAITVDAGSTDPGPHYLGSGEMLVPRVAVERELEQCLRHAMRNRIPLVVGSCGASGSNPGVAWTREIVYYAAATRYTPVGRELVVPPAEVADYLKTERGEAAFCFSGKRGWPGNEDFCLEQIYVPERFGRNLDNARLGKSPLFVQLEERNQVMITEVEQFITAVTASARLARVLSMKQRAAILKAIRVYRLLDRRVAEVSVSHYDPAKFNYTMSLFLE